MSTELETVSKALTDINAVSTGIADLKSQYGGVVYEVVTTVGMEEAKAARLAIRTPRYEVERIRKAAKAPLLALGKKLDAEAARIETELLKIEGPIDQQIKVEEARKETERQAKIDAEIKRVADLQERVSELRGNQMLSASSGSQCISEHIAELEKIVVDASFEEFEAQALDAKEAGIARLRALYAGAVAHEIEQARIKEERQELARLREAQAQRDAEAKAARDAEAAQHAAKMKKEREEHEATAKAERQRIADENEAAKKIRDAEAAKLATERVELAGQQEVLRKAQEPPKPAITKRGVAVKPPSASELIDVLAKHYKAHPDAIIDWLQQAGFAQVKAA
jgi:colicin import membrane protein